MIKQMRRKVIAITGGAMMLLLALIFITINIYMVQLAKEQVDTFLRNLIDNDGLTEFQLLLPERNQKEGEKPFPLSGSKGQVGPPGSIPVIRGFSFIMSEEGQVKSVIYSDKELDVDDETLNSIASMLEPNKKTDGYIEDYRYFLKEYKGDYLIAVADRSVQNGMLENLLKLSVVIGTIGFIVIFVITIFLSRFITKPVELAFAKQKRFISDSSHELKTPLSIVSANLDLLELEQGSSQRIQSMKDGLQRMNRLIQDLLSLARTEMLAGDMMVFNISEVVESVLLPLEVMAYESGNEIESSIHENIMFKGHEESIRKMLGALMENALKYSRRNTKIYVTLYKRNDNLILEVFNEGIGVTKEQKDKLFDKFYRVDDSRHRETGGHGIGLSIVKNVVDMHKGKIIIDSEPDHYIVFKVIL